MYLQPDKDLQFSSKFDLHPKLQFFEEGVQYSSMSKHQEYAQL